MTDSEWKIQAGAAQVEIDPRLLTLTVRHGKTVWRSVARAKELKAHVGAFTEELALADAKSRTASAFELADGKGVEVRLANFALDWAKDFAIRLFVTVRPDPVEVAIRVVAEEKGVLLKQLSWPGPFAVEKASSSNQTVVPYMQGMLLPGDWPQAINPVDATTNGRGLYMPWWGECRGGAGYVVILETPVDAGYDFSHPAGGPTQINPRWDASLGAFRYPRRLRYCFYDTCNYVTLAKRYRRYTLDTGHFVSLAEKIARTPKVAKLIGAPVIHTSILYHVQEDSDYYNKEKPADNHRLVSFDERAKQLRALKKRGLDRAYVHLDGWGVRGYDNLHPDYVPACEEAGGWAGMRRLADACEEIDYVLALHDQYRDYYLDAPSFDRRHAILDEKGEMFTHSLWYGGRQTYLCTSLASAFVRRNWEEIRRQGVKVDSAYLDVFSCVMPDECYNPEHPMSRAECLEARAECFAYIRSLGGVVSSEETTDFAQPHLDLVHHSPYASQPMYQGTDPAGILVPLWNLVYHDAMVVPWAVGGKKAGAWGAGCHAATADAVLNGGMPYLGIEASDEDLALVRQVMKLHEKVALQEMTNHEILDETRRHQRATYADGTVVEADMEEGTFRVK